MAGDSLTQRKAQLDKAEREHLEDVVTEMRDRVKENVRFQLTQQGLDEPPGRDGGAEHVASLAEAIEQEAVDGEDWTDGFEQFVNGVGYTVVIRLAALRCLEVRDFLDEAVTVFEGTGLTPAAERLVQEECLPADDVILEAYHRQCDTLAEELGILFDRTSYSLVDPDDDTFEDLCELLDSVPDEVWRADEVLGWVYEYYNVTLLEDLRRKGDRDGLEPEDVPPANQFYTPHWVVRMLTDNSLGKLYLEHTGELREVVEAQEALSPDERKNRPLSPEESPDIADFCTYLVPSEDEGEPTDFDHPRELRVIDPACGSGHFLLYAFDVLERIWRAETDLDAAAIPRRILRHNLHGVDLDMRACRLAAFNLYLKGRTRTEAAGADDFDMPEVGIVCADAGVADVDGVEAVFEEVAGDDPTVEDALWRILDTFQEVNGLGSLLDVRGTLGDCFEDDSVQLTLDDDPTGSHMLGEVLQSLREAVDKHRNSDSFLAQDLRSFVRLLDVLAQDYDVALMNPPYGSRNRMPETVKSYIEGRYDYSPEFYITFFEVCDRLTDPAGRVGMLVPRSFMFKRSFERFRADFLGEEGGFDFLAEFGLGVLDNATVRTVGTVVRTDSSRDDTGKFIRLYDVETESKEEAFIRGVFSESYAGVKRLFQVPLSEFAQIPKSPVNFAIPTEVRNLHSSNIKIDPDAASISGTGAAKLAQGLATGDNPRFIRKYWETEGIEHFKPIAKGGSEAWLCPKISTTVNYRNEGREMRPLVGSRIQNEDWYGKRGLTWTYIKETGRRFGAIGDGYWFDQTGSMLFPKDDRDMWVMLGVLNSTLYHSLFLSLTPGRHWTPGVVGRIPWYDSLSELAEVGNLTRKQYTQILKWRLTDPTSLYYTGPALLPKEHKEALFYENPATRDTGTALRIDQVGPARQDSISDAIAQLHEQQRTDWDTVESIATEIDTRIYDHLDISPESRDAIQTEIALRTGGVDALEQVGDVDKLAEVKLLVHHFALAALREESDGIVPVESGADQADMFDRIVERFEDAYGEYAGARLVEVDGLLGTRTADGEAYPNLRAFVAEELFDYHVDRMANTPIIWKLTTERLVADANGEGFACFVDYHSLDTGLFDRLTNRYLEPRKAELRERRSAANRRRTDDSLSTSEQAAAAKQYERCASGLTQIGVFEDVLQDLDRTDQRAFDADARDRAAALKAKVRRFREATVSRLDTLDALREMQSEAWFEDTFSPTFWEKVQTWREEWLAALKELERACEAYAAPPDQPVEAHLADCFGYFTRRVKGSAHFAATGILFMTYYFETAGSEFLDADGEPKDGLQDESANRLATLAAGLAEYRALADDIEADCEALDGATPDDWSDRAHSEITTDGYQPTHKHGVAINVRPLAEADIVPTTVDTDVL